jgi:hypothetical protein
MKSYTRFIKNYVFNTNITEDNDKQMKAGYPINQILYENNIKQHKPLENYGVPAGLVIFNNNKQSLNNIYGGTNENVDANINEEEHNKLLEMITYKNKKNKTIKNKKSVF